MTRLILLLNIILIVRGQTITITETSTSTTTLWTNTSSSQLPSSTAPPNSKNCEFACYDFLSYTASSMVNSCACQYLLFSNWIATCSNCYATKNSSFAGILGNMSSNCNQLGISPMETIQSCTPIITYSSNGSSMTIASVSSVVPETSSVVLETSSVSSSGGSKVPVPWTELRGWILIILSLGMVQFFL